MAAPISDEVRTAILADLRAGHDEPTAAKSLRQMARDHGVSTATVRKIADQAKLEGTFDRSRTAAATTAKIADNAARRAALSSRWLDIANRELDKLEQPATQAMVVAGQVTYVQLAEPNARDRQSIIIAAATATDKHIALDKHDAVDDTNDVGESMMKNLDSALEAVYEQLAADGKITKTPLPNTDPAAATATAGGPGTS